MATNILIKLLCTVICWWFLERRQKGKRMYSLFYDMFCHFCFSCMSSSNSSGGNHARCALISLVSIIASSEQRWIDSSDYGELERGGVHILG
mmetsp:Transcript_21385/g.52640  ORF Transcript_21385/g.52640 Transcript_21385/m.52640 type:complete len:92 (-) Transcript_21385:1703-1978(-)